MEADELRTSLGWVEIAGEEDNLATMLCTVFDDGGPEDSDTGWSEAAVAGYEKTRDAIHAHYASALAERDAWIAEFERILSDPDAVHINMLRGTIARPSIEQVRHLYPEEFAALEAERDKLREPPDFPEDWRDDRGFQKGDVLVLRRYGVSSASSLGGSAYLHGTTSVPAYDADTLRRRITYVLTGGQLGIEPGFVVMGLEQEEPAHE